MAAPEDMPAGGFSETFHGKHFDDTDFDIELAQTKGEWGPGRQRWSRPITPEERSRMRGLGPLRRRSGPDP